jgi:hypothetical protein
MRPRIRPFLSIVAVYVIALHTILWGVAPRFTAHPTDPFSDICHSDAALASQTSQSPADPTSAPTHACDHCNLCSAMSLAAVDTAPANYLSPMRQLQILRPLSATGRGHAATTRHLARGPPGFA